MSNINTGKTENIDTLPIFGINKCIHENQPNEKLELFNGHHPLHILVFWSKLWSKTGS
jgi:hypothetical protein